MIVTVTMNPAIDKTIEIEHLEVGGLNRIQKTFQDVGGKGINVSKTLKELGVESVATGFVAGHTGDEIENFLQKIGIQTDFVKVDGETRTNTKVFEKNGVLTEFNESGVVISEEDLDKLLKKLDSYANSETLFILAGSIPKGIEKDVYAKVITRVHKKGSKVLMDADGDLFVKGLDAAPDMIKPNRVELEELMGIDYRASEAEIIQFAKVIQQKGIEKIAVSMGKSGAIFLFEDEIYKARGLSVKAHSTVGAGDAMVAAMAYAYEKKIVKEEIVKLCIAVSAGAVMTVGTKPPDLEMVKELKQQVEIEKI